VKKRTSSPVVSVIPLSQASDNRLLEISRTMGLSLNLTEMKAIQAKFRSLRREPKDIELETLAQTWSEHCKHKVFSSSVELKLGGKTIRYDNFFKETIRRTTAEVRKSKGKKDFCVSVFTDNAGIIRFDETHSVAFKVETHNHPSALDPYGGANTGIGGVIRDILGCGLGAKPLFNTDIFCFGPPDFPDDQVPKGVMHPRRIMRGVVAGVRDYGNRMGIPTVNGAVWFHDRYLGNPLVYCGTAGIIPNNRIAKRTPPNCDIIAAGGRTGRDGIHGATFSSADLTTESETISSQAVQIGNPIEEKKLLDIMLKARDLGLYVNVTDCGAGGFASATGEICKETGADVWLDKAPLKYQGLKPWEIFLSESQERMVFIVRPEKTKELIRLFASEDVEAVVIGRTTGNGHLRLFYAKELIGDLDMEFLHEGTPPRTYKVAWKPSSSKDPVIKRSSIDCASLLKRMLSHPNSASKETIVRQYDHEVGGGTFLKPLQGSRSDGPGDASAVAPFLDKPEKCVFVANGMNPLYGLSDPYRMAVSAVDEALRQITAAGGPPEATAILDNCCWGNPDGEGQMASFVMAIRGASEAATAYGLPFISGKDSFYNEFLMKGKRISIPPSLLISSIAVGETRNITPSWFQGPDRIVFLVGITKNELGGSSFYNILKKSGGSVPGADLKNAPQTFRAVHAAISSGLIDSCHDLSENGLAGALAESAFSGEVGVSADLVKVVRTSDCKSDPTLLFSESNTRFLCGVKAADADRFSALMKKHGIRNSAIGRTDASAVVRIAGLDGSIVLEESCEALKRAWQTRIG
jgi:phosphoribosylformylglycinamidine synthase